jgi:hypothetical protein
MLNMLHLQLETEIAIYNKLAQQNRKDAIARITLSKIEAKIKALQKVIHDQEARQIHSKHRDSHSIIYYVRQVMHRLRDYKNARDYSIFRVPTKAVLQAQAGTR